MEPQLWTLSRVLGPQPQFWVSPGSSFFPTLCTLRSLPLPAPPVHGYPMASVHCQRVSLDPSLCVLHPRPQEGASVWLDRHWALGQALEPGY